MTMRRMTTPAVIVRPSDWKIAPMFISCLVRWAETEKA
jgi:hypothetical protein